MAESPRERGNGLVPGTFLSKYKVQGCPKKTVKSAKYVVNIIANFLKKKKSDSFDL